jgi:hypothetical protein
MSEGRHFGRGQTTPSPAGCKFANADEISASIISDQRLLRLKQKVQVDHRVKIRLWWTTDEKGQTVLLLKHGLKPLEFEKGKSGIVIGPREKLSEVIDAVIAATRAGELDTLLGQSKAANETAGKKKVA